jgi:hypothetical protein
MDNLNNKVSQTMKLKWEEILISNNDKVYKSQVGDYIFRIYKKGDKFCLSSLKRKDSGKISPLYGTEDGEKRIKIFIDLKPEEVMQEFDSLESLKKCYINLIENKINEKNVIKDMYLSNIKIENELYPDIVFHVENKVIRIKRTLNLFPDSNKND